MYIGFLKAFSMKTGVKMRLMRAVRVNQKSELKNAKTLPRTAEYSDNSLCLSLQVTLSHYT